MGTVRLQLLIFVMFWAMCWNGQKANGQGTPTVTALVYEETTRSFTCTSTGGPATTVTWRKNGVLIPMNATYHQTQVVTSVAAGTYENVLTIAQSVTAIFGRYSCTVRNTRGTSTIEATISSLQVFIMQESNPTAGQSHTFTCNVTTQGRLAGIPNVQWIYPIATSGNFTVSSIPPYTLTINPLLQSQDGQYTCQATIGTVTSTSSATLHVEAPTVSVMITPVGTPVIGQNYSLRCSVSGADALSPSNTYHWYNESSNPRSQFATTNLYTFTSLQPYHDGQYTCEVTVVSPYLNGHITQRAMQEIILQRVQLTSLNASTRKYTNNSIVTITDIGTNSSALLCTTTNPGCCSSVNPETQWFFPNGSAVPNQDLPYYRTRCNPEYKCTHPAPRSVQLNRNPRGTLSGIFHCDIPDAKGVLLTMFVGIYDSYTGAPIATTLVYNETTRSLTCNSTGGPATTVTWRKNGTVITINSTYQQTQVVTNSFTGTYETVLTIAQSVTDIFARYSCRVENTRGTSTIEATVSSLQVFITAEADSTASQSYTFICTVTPQRSLTGTPTVQWMGPGSSDLIATGGDFTVGSTPPYTLTINRLHQYQDGQYTCQATIGTVTGISSATLRVQVPPVSVMITPVSTPVAGQSYSLSCSVHGTDSLSPTTTIYNWYNESSNPRSLVATTNLYTLTRLQPYHDGQYTCEVTVVSPYLNGNFTRRAMQEIIVQNPLPTAPIVTLGAATPTSIVVSWSQQAPVDIYEISFQRATGNQQLGDCSSFQHNDSISVGGNITICNLTGLQEFSTYFIIVTAVNVAGRNESNPIVVNTQMTGSSASPDMLREVKITSTNITIAWDAINCVDRNGNITGYEVHYTPLPTVDHGSGNVTVAGTGDAGSMLTIDGLTPSTHYLIQVAAINSDGDVGQLSTALSVQTAPGPVNVATQLLVCASGALSLTGAVVGASIGTALLCTAVLLVVILALALRNKRRHSTEIEMKECAAYEVHASEVAVHNSTDERIYENPL